jgi:hypothetical protein
MVLGGGIGGGEFGGEVGEVGEGEFSGVGFGADAEEADGVLDYVAIVCSAHGGWRGEYGRACWLDVL